MLEQHRHSVTLVVLQVASGSVEELEDELSVEELERLAIDDKKELDSIAV